MARLAMAPSRQRPMNPWRPLKVKRFRKAVFAHPVGPNQRRRPPGTFIFYFMERMRDARRNARRGFAPPIITIVKQASQSWKLLTPVQKELYRKRYAKEFARIQQRRIAGRPSNGQAAAASRGGY